MIPNDLGNRYSSVTIVAVITSKLSPVPYPVEVTVVPPKAKQPLGTFEPPAMRQVDEAFKISLGQVNL